MGPNLPLQWNDTVIQVFSNSKMTTLTYDWLSSIVVIFRKSFHTRLGWSNDFMGIVHKLVLCTTQLTKFNMTLSCYVSINKLKWSYRNSVPFTPTQMEAIYSGMQPGLTIIVGPPGTGKTDVAVQIISNIYHNFPDQRTIIVTHSNQVFIQCSLVLIFSVIVKNFGIYTSMFYFCGACRCLS
jgi:hypothetical protein